MMIEIFWRRFDARNAQARNPRRKKIFVSTTSLPSTLLFRKRTCVCSSLLPATDNISTKSLCFNHFFCFHFNFLKRTCVCSSLLPTADHGFSKRNFESYPVYSHVYLFLSASYSRLDFFSSTSKSNFSYVCFILSSWSYSSNQFPLNPQ